MILVLQIIGWVLLGLLALMALLLVVPVTVIPQWQHGEFTARVRLLGFITLRIYPQKQSKKPAPEKPPAPPGEPPPEKPPEEKPKRAITFDTILDLVSAAGQTAQAALRSLRLTHLRITIPIHGETPMDTAVEYGKMHAYLGTGLGALQNALNLRIEKIEVIADFNDEFSDSTYFYCRIHAMPVQMLIASRYVLSALLTGLPKKRKGAQPKSAQPASTQQQST